MAINDKLQAALAQVIDKTVDGIDASVAFLSEQIPDVIQQLLVWKFMLNFIAFVVPAVMLLVTGRMAWNRLKSYQARYSAYKSHEYWKALKQRDAAYDAYMKATTFDRDSHQRLAFAHNAACEALSKIERPSLPLVPVDFYVCAAIAGASLMATAILVNLTWLQILVAPKIYLIEYAASLAK